MVTSFIDRDEYAEDHGVPDSEDADTMEIDTWGDAEVDIDANMPIEAVPKAEGTGEVRDLETELNGNAYRPARTEVPPIFLDNSHDITERKIVNLLAIASASLLIIPVTVSIAHSLILHRTIGLLSG